MPESNCACAAGSSAAPSPMASAARTSFFIALSFSSAVGVAKPHSNTALLLCGKNFSLHLSKTVGPWLAPRVPFFFFAFELGGLVRSQLLACQHSCGAGGLVEVLGIGRVFGVVSSQ